ncbi:MAG: glycosyltransferase family 4 protein [Microthrixaceae bacterium]|nr:glycosyltransferase family 4 protein [Microthrixaceae bacterium]
MRHLLVTNDFPPKLGGIQSYLWELWRRLPAEDVTVLTSPHDRSGAFDAAQPFRVERIREPVLLPHPLLARRILTLADEVEAELILLDPALPLGLLGPALGRPYGLVLHGAEVTVPGRLPLSGSVLRRVLGGADLVVAAGGYPLAEAQRAARRTLPSVVVPPGVDTARFVPLDPSSRSAARARFGIAPEATVVLGVSRLVPRKGFDTLIEATARLGRHDVELVIAGAGRDQARLERLAEGRRVRFLGRVDDDDLPALYGCADLFSMLCRDRWLGLEQEGFGIVFLEAAATAVASLAGRSGGSHEAVVDGATGLVVDRPTDVDEVAAALEVLVDDAELRARFGLAARERAVAEFDYDLLATRLHDAIAGSVPGALR